MDWLASIQNADGGWLCPYWKAHIRDTHSCFYGTICALEALAEIPKDRRTAAVQDTVGRGAEFLLMHRLYRADHHDFQVINANWLRLAFPWFYGYDILRGLWVLTRLGILNERIGGRPGSVAGEAEPRGEVGAGIHPLRADASQPGTEGATEQVDHPLRPAGA